MAETQRPISLNWKTTLIPLVIQVFIFTLAAMSWSYKNSFKYRKGKAHKKCYPYNCEIIQISNVHLMRVRREAEGSFCQHFKGQKEEDVFCNLFSNLKYRLWQTGKRKRTKFHNSNSPVFPFLFLSPSASHLSAKLPVYYWKTV